MMPILDITAASPFIVLVLSPTVGSIPCTLFGSAHHAHHEMSSNIMYLDASRRSPAHGKISKALPR